ncbi:MAG: DsrE family protein [Burkholderiaceae bacterium]
MTPPNPPSEPATQLVVVLSNSSADAQGAALLALRYAATAAAMDVATQVHIVSGAAVRLFERTGVSAPLAAQAQQAREHGVEIFACPMALAEQGLRTDELVAEVCGVRGAASLLGSGFTSGARFLSF